MEARAVMSRADDEVWKEIEELVGPIPDVHVWQESCPIHPGQECDFVRHLNRTHEATFKAHRANARQGVGPGNLVRGPWKGAC